MDCRNNTMDGSKYEIGRVAPVSFAGEQKHAETQWGQRSRTMSKIRNILIAVFVMACLVSSMAVADPLPGRDILKFQQAPMIVTPVDGALYFGHDELSTLYALDPDNPTSYQGIAMADDFADEFNTPVVHVKWWGSYLDNQFSSPISKFLISFESDAPAVSGDPDSFSHPDQPLLSQIVTAGPLAPGSGTFTEKFVFSPAPALGDDVYEYNAELKLPFDQQPNTVYWLKIAALIDDSSEFARWGWHNRDYTLMDPLASGLVTPGEYIEGVTGGGTDVWHFQDDAVSADTFLFLNAVDGGWDVDQTNYIPQHYMDGVDGPIPDATGDGGIGQFSKDLAFELYTIPEPATFAVLALGAIAGLIRRRK